MSTNKPPKSKPEVHVHDPSKLLGKLKAIGGSMSDDWNNILANQTTGLVAGPDAASSSTSLPE
jgi:hypothetical protein